MSGVTVAAVGIRKSRADQPAWIEIRAMIPRTILRPSKASGTARAIFGQGVRPARLRFFGSSDILVPWDATRARAALRLLAGQDDGLTDRGEHVRADRGRQEQCSAAPERHAAVSAA